MLYKIDHWFCFKRTREQIDVVDVRVRPPQPLDDGRRDLAAQIVEILRSEVKKKRL